MRQGDSYGCCMESEAWAVELHLDPMPAHHLLKHIQHCTRQLPTLQRCKHILFNKLLAPRQADEAGAARQAGEEGGIQDAAGREGREEESFHSVVSYVALLAYMPIAALAPS